MKRSHSPPLPRPSDGELAILQVLWRLGPSTVRQVQEVLDAEQPTGYTTILKQLQIMTGKGLVSRDESNRTHVYRAAEQAQKTQRRLLGDLVERAFGGSTAQVMMQSLSLKRATKAELDEIRDLLDEMQARSPRRALVSPLPMLDVQQAQLAAAVLARFIWEAALLALWCVLSWRVIPVRYARIRYAIGCAALLLLAAAPVSTALLLSSRAPTALQTDESQSNSSLLTGAPASARWPGAHALAPMLSTLSTAKDGALREAAALVPRAAVWTAALWASGFLGLLSRLLFSVRAARRLRAGARPARDGRWREAMDRLAPDSPALLLESPLLEVPVVVGWWTPASPRSNQGDRSACGQRGARARARAHRAGRCRVNLGQCLLEAALFFHPAVWWLSSRVRQEREACCDDAAVRRCGDAQLYARALLELETSRAAVPSGALGASGSTLPNESAVSRERRWSPRISCMACRSC